ncbi:MAG TPA: ribonuclease P protein component [Candidatus Paceibacterota bacterium]
MLPKSSRLGAQEVRAVIQGGRSVRAEGLSAKFKASSTPKVAVVVSKKVVGGAVERNRLRRLVYQHLPEPLPRAHVVLFVLSSAFNPLQVAKLCSQLS